jgi:hypothetical protein
VQNAADVRGEMFLATRRPRGIADQDAAIGVEVKRKTDADAVLLRCCT